MQSVAGDNWRAALVGDLESLRAALPDKLGSMPNPGVHPQVWESLWTSFPGSWKSLVALFVRRAGRVCDLCTSESGSESEGASLCSECCRVFPTVSVLVSHRTRVHGHRNPFSIRVQGTVCLRCGVDFRSRPRLIAHLGKVRECGQLALEFTILSEASQHEADATDAEAFRAASRAGRHPLAGPPAVAPV